MIRSLSTSDFNTLSMIVSSMDTQTISSAFAVQVVGALKSTLIQFRGLVLPTDTVDSGSGTQELTGISDILDPVTDATGSSQTGSDGGGFGQFIGFIGD
jgi:hypothetical protein